MTPLDPAIARWKEFLHYDPTRWLLATDDPSILLWTQLDLAHRPPDATGVIATRARVTESDTVQTLLRAQNELGYWDSPDMLAAPPYRATLWNLSVLAELGQDPGSRRARNACAFASAHADADSDAWRALTPVERGYLAHSLSYFGFPKDERVVGLVRALLEHAATLEERVTALWSAYGYAGRDDWEAAQERALEGLLAEIAVLTPDPSLTFPQFAPRDLLFVLRVLARYGRAKDPRARHWFKALVEQQNESAQWTLARDLNAHLRTPLEPAGAPSRWLTLNALRVIVAVIQM